MSQFGFCPASIGVRTPGEVYADPVRPLPYTYCCVSRGLRVGQTGVPGMRGLRGEVLGNEIEHGEIVECDDEVQLVDTLPTP